MRSRAIGAGVLSLVVVVMASVALAAGSAQGTQAGAAGNGLIAFARAGGVYIMRSDGSDGRLLWRGDAGPKDLSWSRDGSRLAISTWGLEPSYGQPTAKVWVVNADGSSPVPVAQVAADSLSWSPDGRRIAFTLLGAKENPNWPKRAIWVMNADGSGMRRLFSLSRLGKVSAGPSNIDWSPDGRRIVLSAHGGWLAWIYVVNVDGTSLRRLSPSSWAWDDDPEWSPDGRRIAYFGSPRSIITDNTPEIYVTDPMGRSHVRLTRNWVADESPTWSADGSRIAFVRGGTLQHSGDIYVMNADGTHVRRLTEGECPRWRPVAAP